MKKNDKKASKNTAALLKKLTAEELTGTAGGFTIKFCTTCGLLGSTGTVS